MLLTLLAQYAPYSRLSVMASILYVLILALSVLVGVALGAAFIICIFMTVMDVRKWLKARQKHNDQGKTFARRLSGIPRLQQQNYF